MIPEWIVDLCRSVQAQIGYGWKLVCFANGNALAVFKGLSIIAVQVIIPIFFVVILANGFRALGRRAWVTLILTVIFVIVGYVFPGGG